MNQRKAPTLVLGDVVMYARDFLRSTAMFAGEAAHMKGEVVALFDPVRGTDRRLITVKWDNGRAFNVLNVNLVRANRRHLEPV